MSITLPHNFTARPYQEDFFSAMNKGCKRAVLVWNRRAGKDTSAWNFMIYTAVETKGIYYYVFPTFAQGRKVLWDGMTMGGYRFLDFIPKELIKNINNQEMKIRLSNGSLIQIVGSDNYDAIMGTNPSGCIFSEYAMQNPNAWQYIRPILDANDGWAIFVFTPRGSNHAKDIYDMALMPQNRGNWFCQRLTIDNTNVISKETLQKIRDEGTSEDMIQQEWYCFPKGQFVMTSQGMKDISEIVPGDMVYTHTGRYRKVLDIMSRHYSGELLTIKSFGSNEDIVCTPNHPFRIYDKSKQTYRWVNADALKVKDRLCFPKITLEESKFITLELALLIAWYITEGSSSENGFQFTVADILEAKIIENLLTKLNVECLISKGATAYNVRVNNTTYLDFFKVHCGTTASDKKIPLNLIKGYEKEFLDTLIEGDGCRYLSRKSARWAFSTISKTLAYQVQTLAHSLGYTGGIYKGPARDSVIEGRKVKCQERYNVTMKPLEMRKELEGLQRSKYSVIGSIRSVTAKQFEGTVYNLKVQYDESYTVNGRAVHNCSFTLGIQGSYFAKYMEEARQEERICRVVHEKQGRVNTSWDLGYGDSTSIIFYQVVHNEIHIIDFYENHGKELSHYAKIIADKPYIYDRHFVPHDADKHELSTGLSVTEVGSSLGLQFTVLPTLRISHEESIECCRSIFPRVWIDDTKCAHLIKALENYRCEYDEGKQIYKPRAVHDKWSHSADSYRYLNIAVRKYVDQQKWGPSDDYVEGMLAKHQPVFK